MKTVSYISFLAVLVIVVSAFFIPVTALATDNVTSSNVTSANITNANITPTLTPAPTPTPVGEAEPVYDDNITITTEYPALDALATGSFQFNMELAYRGKIQRVFDLKASGPSGWDIYIQPQYEAGKKISSITIDSSYSSMTKQITLVATPPSAPIADPGNYKILLQATSGNVTSSIQLVAKITAKYALYAVPVNQLYNTNAQAGKDNIYSIQLSNTGSATIESIVFSSSHPDGWEIKFSPEKIDSLKTSDLKTIDVNIKPAAKSVSGDYMITFRISGKEASASNMDIRVTVKTPTIWGWVSVIIILVVVAGLFLVIMRFGRR
jgi:uncharacterized membrane protein